MCLKFGDLIRVSQNITIKKVPNYSVIIGEMIHTLAATGGLLGMASTHLKMEKKALGMQENSEIQCN